MQVPWPGKPDIKKTWLARKFQITNHKLQKMGCPSDKFKRLRRRVGAKNFSLLPFVILDIVIWDLFVICIL